MPLNDPIGSSALDVLQRNASDMDKFISQQTGTVTTRLGETLVPLPVRDAELLAAVQATGWFIAGTFAAGFTFTARNQVGRDSTGELWSYNGATLPFSVSAGTVPSEPTYTNRGDAALRSALALGTADIGGVPASTLAIASVTVASIKALGSITSPRSGIQYNVTGYYAGTRIGGDPFIYDSTMPRSNHNGGTIIAPPAIAAWNGTQADIATILNWTGTGNGCYVRVGVKVPHVNMFGAVSDANLTTKSGSDNLIPFRKVAQAFSEWSFDGGGAYRLSDTVSPNKKFTLHGGTSTWFCSDKTKIGVNLAGCSDSDIYWGDFTHLTVKTDYNEDTCVPFFYNSGTQTVSNITFNHSHIYRTARQGIRNDGGGNNWNVVICLIEETLRDGVFLLNCTNSKVSLCTFKNTGDDSIAFAGNSSGAIATSNTIEGAGSFNLGGSGIRFNKSGTASDNTITNSDLFGIVCAVNSDIPGARPENLKLIGNTIKGIVKTGTVTAGIGFLGCTDVECVNNDIEMSAKEAHAYRIYGNDQSGTISISGGQIKNALSVLYCRNNAAKNIKISDAISSNCDDFVFMDAVVSGVFNVDNIELYRNKSVNTTNSIYIRYSSSNTITTTNIVTGSNRFETPNAIPFIFNSKVVGKWQSANDQWPTGVFPDYSAETNVSSIVIDRRMLEKTSANNEVTFNATNSGLISFGATPLSRAPLTSDIRLTAKTSLGAAKDAFVDFSDSVNFRIRLDTAPAADVTFAWAVNTYDNQRIK